MDFDRVRASIGRMRQERLGRLALSRGWISESQLEVALSGGLLEETLVSCGWVTEARLAELRLELDRPAALGVVGGRYELRERLGEGAVSVVFRAVDRELGRDVAVKVLKENFLTHETVRERFQREARAMAQLDHPHVLKVHDAGEDGHLLFIVLELIDGQPLGLLIDREPRDPRPILPLLEKAARGVHHAHEKGIIHRDLKPENILVTAAGEPKVADFGLAHLAAETAPALTRSGSVLGTPLYMAPEQVKGGGQVTPRTDVYALGAILYKTLAGRPPHTGTSPSEVYDKIAREDPLPPRRVDPNVPWEVEAICEKALAKDPARRYPTAGAFADELRRFLEGEPVQARPVTRIQRLWRRAAKHRAVLAPVAAALVLAAAASIWAWRSSADRRRQEEAIRLLESALPPLTRATAALYNKEVDYEFVQGPLREAQGLIEGAVARAPDLPLGHYRLGEALELRGDFGRAEESFREATRLDPGFGPARYRLGRVLLWRAHLASIWWWDDQKEASRRTSEHYAREGGREIEAAGRLASGFDGEVQREIAAAMLARLGGDPEAVRRLCGEAIRRFGRREGVEELYWLLGMAQDKPECLKSLDEAIAIRPRFPFALYARGNARKEMKDEEGAIADFTEAVRVSPGFAEAYLDRGSLRWGRGDGPGALEDFDRLIRMGVLLPGAYLGRGRTLSEVLGKPAEAVPDLSEAIRLQPRRYGLARIARAKAYLALERNADALTDAEEAVAQGAAWAETFFIRGRARSRLGDKSGALNDFKAALDGSGTPDFDRRVRGEIERLRAPD